MSVPIGLRGERRLVVGEADTAVAVGSGDVPVLATPRLLALAEAATVAALAGRLEPGTTSVGTSVSLEHRAASPVGAEVLAGALLVEVTGRHLVFQVEVSDPAVPGKPLAVGRIERQIVDRERFLGYLDRAP